MAMPHFEYHQPTSLEEALDLLAAHRADVRVIAGGTDLVPRMRLGAMAPGHVVSINRIPGLRAITYQPDDGLVIGAAARVSEVAAHPDVQQNYPALAYACRVMATPQVRNMATVAGNIANSSPSADTAAPLLAYDAKVVLVERGGRRQVPLKDFFTGPGQNVMENMEMIEAIRVPSPPPGAGSCYLRISARSKVDIAAVGVAAMVVLDPSGGILAARIALGAVAPTPLRAFEAEEILTGAEPSDELIKRAAAACVRASRPIDDVRASAAWRRAMVEVLARRAISRCIEMAKEGE